MSDDDVILSVRGVSKRYGLPPLLPWNKRPDGGHYALRDIGFEVRRGESFGILGPNGAGKSTLLKVLAGVTPPDEGEVEVRGRLFPMIELNAGMNMELPGRDNIEVLGAIMGMSAAEIKAKAPQIEAFSELGEWLDKPLWSYSSGMIARLGFSIAINVDADILLVDEVLAVGDIAFQKKCMARIQQMTAKGITIILVSHSPYQIERICEKALLLQTGRLVDIGEPKSVMKTYFTAMDQKISAQEAQEVTEERQRRGSGDIRVNEVVFLNEDGERVDSVESGSPLLVELHVTATEGVRSPNFGLRFSDRQNTLLLSLQAMANKPVFVPTGRHVVRCRIASMPFITTDLTLGIKASSSVLLDSWENAARIRIVSTPGQNMNTGAIGIVYADPEWSFRTVPDEDDVGVEVCQLAVEQK